MKNETAIKHFKEFGIENPKNEQIEKYKELASIGGTKKDKLMLILQNNEDPVSALLEYNKQPRCPTKKRFVILYGNKEGNKKWEDYRTKQSKTNTFEYKRKKYGWSREQFDEYNKSRSVTLENCVKRHGKTKGKRVFEEYCQKQKEAGCSKKYFIEKYGYDKGIERYLEVNKRKAITLENYQKRLGNELGLKRYEEYLDNLSNSQTGSSLKATKFFTELYQSLDKENHHCYFKGHPNKEFDREYLVRGETGIIFLYDFVCTLSKKCIEYNGNYWHCNPEFYSSDFYHPHAKLLAEELWEKDRQKNEFLMTHRGYEVKTVWESWVDNDSESVIMDCKRWLNS